MSNPLTNIHTENTNPLVSLVSGSVDTEVDGGDIVVHLTLVAAPDSPGDNVVFATWLTDPATGQDVVQEFNAPIAFFGQGKSNAVTLRVSAPRTGHYAALKVAMGNTGNYFRAEAVISADVSVTWMRLQAPRYTVDNDAITIDTATEMVVLPFLFEYPQGTILKDGGMIFMGKGEPPYNAFAQNWVQLQSGHAPNVVELVPPVEIALSTDHHSSYHGQMKLPAPAKTGVYAFEFMVFDNNWQGTLFYQYPKPSFVVGNPFPRPSVIPDIAKAFTPQGKSPVAFSGNRGNRFATGLDVTHTSVSDFAQLAGYGLQVVRLNVSLWKWLRSAFYRTLIDGVVNNIMAAGLTACVAFQDLRCLSGLDANKQPLWTEMTLDDACAGAAMMAQMWHSSNNGGMPYVMLDWNEPHQLGLLTDSKAGYVDAIVKWGQAIRSVDPNAYICLPAPNYCESVQPLLKTRVDGQTWHDYMQAQCRFDIACVHPYCKAEQVKERCTAPFPVWVQEYSPGVTGADGDVGDSTAYRQQFHAALLSVPNIVSWADWDWIDKAYEWDRNVLMEAVSDTAPLTLNARGKDVAADYAALIATGSLAVTSTPVPAPAPAPAPSPSPNPSPAPAPTPVVKGITEEELTQKFADEMAAIDAKLKPLTDALAALSEAEKADEAKIAQAIADFHAEQAKVDAALAADDARDAAQQQQIVELQQSELKLTARVSAVEASLSALTAPPIVLAPVQTSVTGLYNTGTSSSNKAAGQGLEDLHWALTSTPSGRSGIAYTAETNNLRGDMGYLTPSDISLSLSPTANVLSGQNAPGLYTYQTQFTIKGDPSKVTITGRVAADDGVTAILLNGKTVASNVVGYNTWQAITLHEELVTGLNILQIVVSNHGTTNNPTGLRGEFRAAIAN